MPVHCSGSCVAELMKTIRRGRGLRPNSTLQALSGFTICATRRLRSGWRLALTRKWSSEYSAA